MLDLPQFIRAEAKRAEFFAELVKRVDTVANLEQAEAESRAQIDGNRLTAAEIVGKAKDEARAILADAQAQRNAIASDREAANRQAAEIIAASQNAASKTNAETADRLAVAKNAEREAEAEERRAKKRLAEAQAQIAEMEPRLADAQAVIARAEAIKKAMG